MTSRIILRPTVLSEGPVTVVLRDPSGRPEVNDAFEVLMATLGMLEGIPVFHHNSSYSEAQMHDAILSLVAHGYTLEEIARVVAPSQDAVIIQRVRVELVILCAGAVAMASVHLVNELRA